MTYYKVTTNDQLSICTSRIHGYSRFCVRYKVGQWVYPAKGTKLFCFSDWGSACRFGENESRNFLIWEAEVQNPVEEYNLYYYPVYSHYWARELEQRIIAVQAGHTAFFDNTWPKNTVFADAVKLTKLVEEVI